MVRTWSLLLAVLAFALPAGCKKSTPVPAGDLPPEIPSGFVEISLEDEEEDLESMFASELMVATAKCGDLVRMEPAAMMGNLSDGEIRCLDKSLRDAERQTVKDKISRVLMADAWAKGDNHRWESIARRHVEQIDRSDPDMCYLLARYLSDQGADKAEEAMKWADVALENRSVWTGDLHVKRVFSLYKLKATSAQKLWSSQERIYVDDPSDENFNTMGETRNLTKTLAREWLEYARKSGKDPTMAEQLCVSAAGTEDFCDE